MPAEMPVIMKIDAERAARLKQISCEMYNFLQSRTDNPVDQLAVLTSIKMGIEKVCGFDFEVIEVSCPVLPVSGGNA